MNIFDHEFGDFKMVNLENFFDSWNRRYEKRNGK